MHRVLRWDVPVGNEWHEIGAGPVVHVAARDYRRKPGDLIEVWTLEHVPDDATTFDVPKRSVGVFGTNHPLPDAVYHIGTAIVPSFRVVGGPTRGTVERIETAADLVWHVFAKNDRPATNGELSNRVARIAGDEPQIGGFKRGQLVHIDSVNIDDYDDEDAVVVTLDHDHGWRLWVRMGDDPHNHQRPAIYVSPDDLAVRS